MTGLSRIGARAIARAVVVGVTGLLLSSCVASAQMGPAADTSPAAEKRLTKQVLAAKDQAATTGQTIVRGDWGYWDASTQEAYIDSGARIAHVDGNRLVYVAPGATDRASDGLAALAWPAVCNDTTNFTHCEQSLDRSGCRPTYAYLNYNDATDKFANQYGAPIYPGEWINVRNAPYRMIGPRGVRIYRVDRWLFMSNNCLQ